MKQKFKDFFLTLGYYVSFPYYWFSTRKIDKKFTQMAEEERVAPITEKDVELLKSIGVETDLETLRNKCKNNERQK